MPVTTRHWAASSVIGPPAGGTDTSRGRASIDGITAMISRHSAMRRSVSASRPATSTARSAGHDGRRSASNSKEPSV